MPPPRKPSDEIKILLYELRPLIGTSPESLPTMIPLMEPHWIWGKKYWLYDQGVVLKGSGGDFGEGNGKGKGRGEVREEKWEGKREGGGDEENIGKGQCGGWAKIMLFCSGSYHFPTRCTLGVPLWNASNSIPIKKKVRNGCCHLNLLISQWVWSR